MKVSVVMIAHNEEKQIGKSLQSASWADEIIVVDCESSDRTVEIAKIFTDLIFKRPNDPNLNVNKNFAISKATCDWILVLDADEIISEELQKEILSTINSPDTKDGYYIPRKNYFLGKWLKHGGHYPDWQLRLFHRGKGRFPEKSVHESLQVEGEIGFLKNPLTHYSYLSLEELLRKIDLYARGDFKHLKERGWKVKPTNCFWFFILRPFLVFCQKYFLKLGFLDGVEGLIFAISSAYADFYRLAYYWHQSRKEKS